MLLEWIKQAEYLLLDAGNQPKLPGSLAPGKKADIVILQANARRHRQYAIAVRRRSAGRLFRFG
jgi:cytosine/adenosine deaminase-related metal-dependent hydrolase